jgi:hypothetical protein
VVKFAVKTGMKVDNVDVYPNHTELLNPYVAFSVWSEVVKIFRTTAPPDLGSTLLKRRIFRSWWFPGSHNVA